MDRRKSFKRFVANVYQRGIKVAGQDEGKLRLVLSSQRVRKHKISACNSGLNVLSSRALCLIFAFRGAAKIYLFKRNEIL